MTDDLSKDVEYWRQSARELAKKVSDLEDERDEALARNAALVEEAAAAIPDETDDAWIKNLRPPHTKRMLAVARKAIRALATPAERDALAERDARIWTEAKHLVGLWGSEEYENHGIVEGGRDDEVYSLARIDAVEFLEKHLAAIRKGD